MPQGKVISLEMIEIEMGDRGSKSPSGVKEQRVDGYLRYEYTPAPLGGRRIINLRLVMCRSSYR